MLNSLLHNIKNQTNKRKHPTQRPLSRILRFAAFAHPCASRKDAEAAERIYVYAGTPYDGAPVAGMARSCNKLCVLCGFATLRWMFVIFSFSTSC
jgi:hypothetical protein